MAITIKPVKMCAVVNRKDMKIHYLDIYGNSEDVKYGLEPDEAVIEVLVTPINQPVFNTSSSKRKKKTDDEDDEIIKADISEEEGAD